MCLRGKPFEVADQYALGVFSTDPQFEEVKEKLNAEEIQEAARPKYLKGKACTKCGKIDPTRLVFTPEYCSGPKT